ncbi:hypothetical protein [Castellaniella sp.]|uniref:hypothetical protein n=1 Tax=Castellaniella sp. TaxID=1955812 RepID=UPI002AFECB66|nr:hypothetical protein [Castellaniella sp.]
MKTHFSQLALALALAAPLTLAGGPAFAADAHQHDAASAAPLTLNHGQKWETDAPLRLAMGKLEQAVVAALPAAHAGTLSDAQYDALSTQAGQEFAYIVEHCKLAPDADAALHVILADMIGGTETVSGKQAGQSRASGVVQLAQALNRYGEYFDHPGWKNVSIPQH